MARQIVGHLDGSALHAEPDGPYEVYPPVLEPRQRVAQVNATEQIQI
jgi:hypothetical protein